MILAIVLIVDVVTKFDKVVAILALLIIAEANVEDVWACRLVVVPELLLAFFEVCLVETEAGLLAS